MVSPLWLRWLVGLGQFQQQTASQPVTPITAVDGAASIATTSLAPTATSAGLYRITWYFRLTQASAGTSDLQITIRWSDHGQAMGHSGPNLTSNTVTSFDTGTIMVYSDSGALITYELTYISMGGPPEAIYNLYVVIESVGL
jgi:hypothetical protein